MECSYFFPKVMRKLLNRAAIKNSVIDRTARIDIGSVVANSMFGKYSYIGEHTSVLEMEV